MDNVSDWVRGTKEARGDGYMPLWRPGLHAEATDQQEAVGLYQYIGSSRRANGRHALFMWDSREMMIASWPSNDLGYLSFPGHAFHFYYLYPSRRRALYPPCSFLNKNPLFSLTPGDTKRQSTVAAQKKLASMTAGPGI